MLKINNISKSFDKKVLSNFSYEFPDKGLYVIKGESGVGKTTLLRIIAGLETPDEGEVIIEKGKKISLLFQDSRLIPYFSVKDNLEFVRKDKDEMLFNKLCEHFGINDFINKYPTELSGGMARRLAIARSIYYGGDIFLWDEPLKELDKKNRDKVIEYMTFLSKSSLIITVSHEDELFNLKNVIEIK